MNNDYELEMRDACNKELTKYCFTYTDDDMAEAAMTFCRGYSDGYNELKTRRDKQDKDNIPLLLFLLFTMCFTGFLLGYLS